MNERLSDFGSIEPVSGLAFGVDDTRAQLYSLRQSRYQALAFDIQEIAGRYAAKGARLKVLDIGVNDGIAKKYLDAWPNSKHIDLYGADIEEGNIHRREAWAGFWTGDFMDGYPDIPSDTFDVVICEQVLEHLPRLETAVRTLERVLRPGGTLFVGVPIFPFGLHLARRHVVPIIDKLNPWARHRGHVQAFSRRTFIRLLRDFTDLEIVSMRGFRILSGGVLRPLENHRFWWRFNRWVGERVPSLCTEIQVIARKPERGS
jgi:SAM-dependent methyltransferase